ncbi:prolyl oligopeptidase family serine peptidase [Nonomuraea sp. NPDC050536]|uniref:S9 family peptidase n=1 Tax=Nonomuraea sp. NPDC050536 TaxID=3364366 RepID=UPI0037CAA0E4
MKASGSVENAAETYLRFADIAYQRSFTHVPRTWQVCYVANELSQPDLWLVDLRTKARRPITQFKDRSVRAFWIADDARTVAIQADVGDERPSLYLADLHDAPSGLRAAPLPDGFRLVAGGAGFLSGTYRLALMLANNQTGTIAAGSLNVLTGKVEVSWDRGGALVPVAIAAGGEALILRGAASNLDSNLYFLDPGLSQPRLLTPHTGECRSEVVDRIFSDSLLPVITDIDAEFSYLAEIDLHSGSTTTVLRVDQDVESAVRLSGGRFLCSVNEAGYSGLLLCDPHGRHPAKVDVPRGVITEMFSGTTPEGRQLIGLGLATPGHPPDLLVAMADHELGAVDWAPVVASRRSPTPRPVIWPESVELGGVPCLLYRPDQAPSAHVPVLISFHGGPEAQERPAFSYNGLYQALLAHGIAVVAPNVSGSTGHGKSYRKRIYGDWGGIDAREATALLDALDELPWCAGTTRGLFGVSYGGFLALTLAALQGRRRVHAVAVLNAPSDLVTLVDELPPAWRTFAARWIGHSKRSAAEIAARSPFQMLGPEFPPLLLVHGGFDARVPATQSVRLHEKATGAGVRSQLVVADGGHGLTRNEEWRSTFSTTAAYFVDHLV